MKKLISALVLAVFLVIPIQLLANPTGPFRCFALTDWWESGDYFLVQQCEYSTGGPDAGQEFLWFTGTDGTNEIMPY